MAELGCLASIPLKYQGFMNISLHEKLLKIISLMVGSLLVAVKYDSRYNIIHGYFNIPLSTKESVEYIANSYYNNKKLQLEIYT